MKRALALGFTLCVLFGFLIGFTGCGYVMAPLSNCDIGEFYSESSAAVWWCSAGTVCTPRYGWDSSLLNYCCKCK